MFIKIDITTQKSYFFNVFKNIKGHCFTLRISRNFLHDKAIKKIIKFILFINKK